MQDHPPPNFLLPHAYHGGMSNDTKTKKPTPFSLRLSVEERQLLEELAGTKPLGAYIRETLLSNAKPRRGRTSRPKEDNIILAQILAELGASRIPNNLNQLARAANTGSLLVTDDVLKDLNEAIQNVSFIKEILIKTLGLRGDYH